MAQRMGLPHSLYTSPPTSTSPDTTFPRLKIKVIPRISLSTNLAPEKPKPKALEETIRIVAPLGAKIALSWSVKTAVLEDVDPLPEGGQHAFEDCIGSWILTNLEQLGIANAEWSVDENGERRATSLVLSPLSASPSHSPMTTHVVPSNEPTAALISLELTFWWAHSHAKGKRKAEELEADCNDENTASAPDDGSLSKSSSLETPQSPPPDEPADIKKTALEQIASLMPEVLRRSMIRRFPYVFDASFLEYREHFELPSSLLTAMSTFAFVSSRHRPAFLSKCTATVSQLEEARMLNLEGQIKAVSRLPKRKRGGKRPKVDSESQQQSQESQEQEEEDARCARAAAAILSLRNGDAQLVPRQSLHRLLAEKVAAIGTAKWMDTRKKRGKMAASKAAVSKFLIRGRIAYGEVDSPDVDYSQGPLAPEVDDAAEPLPGDWQLSNPLSWVPGAPHLHDVMLAPRHHHRDLPMLDWDDEDESLSDEEDKDDYYDALEDEMWELDWDDTVYDDDEFDPPVKPAPFATSQGGEGSESIAAPMHLQTDFNALHLFDKPPASHHSNLQAWEDDGDYDNSDDGLEFDGPGSTIGHVLECPPLRDQEHAIPSCTADSLDVEHGEAGGFGASEAQGPEEDVFSDNESLAIKSNPAGNTHPDDPRTHAPSIPSSLEGWASPNTRNIGIEHHQAIANSADLHADVDLDSDLDEDPEPASKGREGSHGLEPSAPTFDNAGLFSDWHHSSADTSQHQLASLNITHAARPAAADADTHGWDEYRPRRYSVDSLDAEELEFVARTDNDLDGDMRGSEGDRSTGVSRQDRGWKLPQPQGLNAPQNGCRIHHPVDGLARTLPDIAALPFDDIQLEDDELFDDCDEPLDGDDDLLDDDDDHMLDHSPGSYVEQVEGDRVERGHYARAQPATAEYSHPTQTSGPPAPLWAGYLPSRCDEHGDDDEDDIWDEDLM